ncbi:MAG TPA: GNAT family N-acetyltransferase [Kouleothrix sp.]|uniref:GNAT family N-acetyltransferase n=1 Tax=Kouleothrix sp. TaxID=2779161 RepID=UPI002C8772EF|nr:GNAT family N-acetyltransferase [Kouleothrix sp.]HRC75997.1 GNAT family N-acetyltransferase [Kouleothrix sp.]
MSEIVITNSLPEHAEALARHQQICFPTLDPVAWMTAEDFLAQMRAFPEGQHVALDGARVVGQSSTLRVSAEQAFAQHSFLGITGNVTFSTHDPQGEWLYGADMSVHPEYRGRKLSKLLYDARKSLIRRLGLRGMVAGGQLAGYHHYRASMGVEEYIARVVAGELADPTLTPQLRSGFVVRGVLWHYLDDAEHGAEASLIVWENPDL